MEKAATDTYTLEKLRKGGYTYVDKTAILKQLADGSRGSQFFIALAQLPEEEAGQVLRRPMAIRGLITTTPWMPIQQTMLQSALRPCNAPKNKTAKWRFKWRAQGESNSPLRIDSPRS